MNEVDAVQRDELATVERFLTRRGGRAIRRHLATRHQHRAANLRLAPSPWRTSTARPGALIEQKTGKVREIPLNAKPVRSSRDVQQNPNDVYLFQAKGNRAKAARSRTVVRQSRASSKRSARSSASTSARIPCAKPGAQRCTKMACPYDDLQSAEATFHPP